MAANESPAARSARRRAEAEAAGRKAVPQVAAGQNVLDVALAQTQAPPKYVRMQLLITPEQEERLNRLAYEKKLKKVEIVRRMIDKTPDDAV
jgi:hypothetical protein